MPTTSVIVQAASSLTLDPPPPPPHANELDIDADIDIELAIRGTTQLVDESLDRFLTANANNALLDEISRYALGLDRTIVDRQAKRVRPTLCLWVCGALGGALSQALPFAMAIELAHAFMLISDDIQDGDKLRRGRPSVWSRYGVEHAITAAGYLQTLATLSVLDTSASGLPAKRARILSLLLAQTLASTGCGQTLDLLARGRRDLTPRDYEETALKKTGEYLAAPLVAGAIVAGAGPEIIELLWNIGRRLGLAYQLGDDLFDLIPSKGRRRGSDIYEGRRSWLMLELARVCEPSERELLYTILDKPAAQTEASHVEALIALIERYEVDLRGRQALDAQLDACRELALSAPGELRTLLVRVVEYLSGAHRRRS